MKNKYTVIVYEEHSFTVEIEATTVSDAKYLASEMDFDGKKPDSVCTTHIVVEKNED